MKIKNFILIPIISMLIIGIVGAYLLQRQSNSFTVLYEEYFYAETLILEADRDLHQALLAINDVLNNNPNTEEFKNGIDDFNENTQQSNERINKAFSMLKNSKYESLKLKYQEYKEKWYTLANKIILNASNNYDKNLLVSEHKIGLKDFNELRESINQATEYIDKDAVAFLEETDSITTLTIIIFIVLIVITLVITYLMSQKITKPLNEITRIAKAISAGNLNHKIEKHQKGEVGILADSFDLMITTMKKLIDETNTMIHNANSGKLDYRGKSDNFEGDYKQLINGINELMNSIIAPLNVAAEYVDRISKGDIPQKITTEYQGDFNEIKNNLNQCIDAINMLIADINGLSKAIIAGNLNYRIDSHIHNGDFKRIIDGVNFTIDRLVGIVDNMPIPIQIIDKDYNILYKNKNSNIMKN